MLAIGKRQRKASEMTTSYIYQSERGHEWLDSVTALRKAIADSLANGYRTVPISTADFCTLVPANPEDRRTLGEQVLAFASNCGFRYAIENHSAVVRFFAQRETDQLRLPAARLNSNDDNLITIKCVSCIGWLGEIVAIKPSVEHLRSMVEHLASDRNHDVVRIE